jgi:hypothetical protein
MAKRRHASTSKPGAASESRRLVESDGRNLEPVRGEHGMATAAAGNTSGGLVVPGPAPRCSSARSARPRRGERLVKAADGEADPTDHGRR